MLMSAVLGLTLKSLKPQEDRSLLSLTSVCQVLCLSLGLRVCLQAEPASGGQVWCCVQVLWGVGAFRDLSLVHVKVWRPLQTSKTHKQVCVCVCCVWGGG